MYMYVHTGAYTHIHVLQTFHARLRQHQISEATETIAMVGDESYNCCCDIFFS